MKILTPVLVFKICTVSLTCYIICDMLYIYIYIYIIIFIYTLFEWIFHILTRLWLVIPPPPPQDKKKRKK